MHVTVFKATPAAPPESMPPAMLKSERTNLADTHYGKRVYLPAGKLSQRPLILQDIEPILTDGSQSSSESRLILRLLINEYGDVDQVLPEDATLPAPIVSELQQRFLRARFLPGRLKGLAVPSALRIVVTLHTPSEFSGD